MNDREAERRKLELVPSDVAIDPVRTALTSAVPVDPDPNHDDATPCARTLAPIVPRTPSPPGNLITPPQPALPKRAVTPLNGDMALCARTPATCAPMNCTPTVHTPAAPALVNPDPSDATPNTPTPVTHHIRTPTTDATSDRTPGASIPISTVHVKLAPLVPKPKPTPSAPINPSANTPVKSPDPIPAAFVKPDPIVLATTTPLIMREPRDFSALRSGRDNPYRHYRSHPMRRNFTQSPNACQYSRLRPPHFRCPIPPSQVAFKPQSNSWSPHAEPIQLNQHAKLHTPAERQL